MSKTRVGINGFGRIGRLAFRRLFNDDQCEVVAINCSHPTNEIAHLLKYDSTYGRFEKAKDVVALEKSIKIGDYEVAITGERDASKIPWKDLNVDIVIDCKGVYKSAKNAKGHIEK